MDRDQQRAFIDDAEKRHADLSVRLDHERSLLEESLEDIRARRLLDPEEFDKFLDGLDDEP